jgi:hypothetical protein
MKLLPAATLVDERGAKPTCVMAVLLLGLANQ